MSPRTGRPKKDNPKSIDIKVRIDKALNDKLEAYCKEHGEYRAEVIRKAIERLLEA